MKEENNQKVAIVTGAAKGIGRAIAALQQDGFTILSGAQICAL